MMAGGEPGFKLCTQKYGTAGLGSTNRRLVAATVAEDMNDYSQSVRDSMRIVQDYSFGTRPKKMRIYQRLFITF